MTIPVSFLFSPHPPSFISWPGFQGIPYSWSMQWIQTEKALGETPSSSVYGQRLARRAHSWRRLCGKYRFLSVFSSLVLFFWQDCRQAPVRRPPLQLNDSSGHGSYAAISHWIIICPFDQKNWKTGSCSPRGVGRISVSFSN